VQLCAAAGIWQVTSGAVQCLSELQSVCQSCCESAANKILLRFSCESNERGCGTAGNVLRCAAFAAGFESCEKQTFC
jgi:hypothetical protein